MLDDLRKEVVEAIRKVCKTEGATFIRVAILSVYVHMYVSISPIKSVSKIVGRIKGKYSLIIFNRH